MIRAARGRDPRGSSRLPGVARPLRSPTSLATRLGFLALPALALVMLRWTWLAWPDPIVDFGRELYAPWQLAAGKTLYADLAWFNGPLSPYWNALCFRLFGVGLHTLVAVNLVLLAGLTALAHRLLAAASSEGAATAACAVFLLVLAFPQYTGIGNYNFVTPYSHELTHGLLLCFAALTCGVRAERSRHRRDAWRAAMGLALGAAFLTKAEVFLAGAAGCATLLALSLRRTSAGPRVALRAAALPVSSILVPPLVATGLLALALPPGEAVRGVLGTWASLGGGEVASLAFYRHGLGIDDLSGNSARMLAWSAGTLAALAPGAGVALALRGAARPGRRRLAAALVFAATAAGLVLLAPAIPWPHAGRPLPLLLLACAALVAAPLWSPRADAPEARAAPLRLALVVFAVVLLAKMAWNARFVHYGFALAMPGLLVVTVALLDWVPAALARRGAAPGVFRAGALALLAVLVAAHLDLTARQLARKDAWVGRGADAFRTDALRGKVLEAAMEQLGEMLAGGGSLVVLPEGVMLNYLLRAPNPTPYVNFMPPELAIFGEERILAALQRDAPDVVALVHKDTSEYGVPFFGRDYGEALDRWVRSHYRPVRRIGGAPFAPETRFGILLLERLR
jgi:hypothetical protein